MRTGIVCVLAACLVSSVAIAQQVSVNYNHSQSFAQYHTYAWGDVDKNRIANSILPRKHSKTSMPRCNRRGCRWCRRTRILT
jgi:hypothetical protein